MSNTSFMPSEGTTWYLKKHEDGEVFGPVAFAKILEWAQSSQLNPQDLLSEDGAAWLRPPMVAQLEMDWLIGVGDDLYYGPTTKEAVLENADLGLISADTVVINCLDGKSSKLRDLEFYQERTATIESQPLHTASQPIRTGGIRLNLQRRVRELEQQLLTNQRQLNERREKIERLEKKIRELEVRLRDLQAR